MNIAIYYCIIKWNSMTSVEENDSLFVGESKGTNTLQTADAVRNDDFQIEKVLTPPPPSYTPLTSKTNETNSIFNRFFTGGSETSSDKPDLLSEIEAP